MSDLCAACVQLFCASSVDPPGVAPSGRRCRWTIAIGAAALAVSYGFPAHADEWTFTADGSLRASYWSGTRSLDELTNIGRAELWTKGQANIGSFGVLKGDGWVAAQTEERPMQDRSRELRGERIGSLRELYWQISTEAVDLRIGRQLILWGRADAVNPTDSLTPQDFTLLASLDSDQRFGDFAVQLTAIRESYAFSAIWLPEFQSDVVPLPTIASVSYRYLGAAAGHRQLAFKLDRSSGAFDWSVSYFEGYERRPDVGLLSLTPQQIIVGVSNPPVRVVGFDGSTGVGNYVLRTEAAWHQIEGGGSGPGHQHSSAEWVIGGERRFLDKIDVGLQYFAKRTSGFADPHAIENPVLGAIALEDAVLTEQTQPFRQGMTLRVASRWDDDRWEAELSGLVAFEPGDSIVRAHVRHFIYEHLRIELGIERFRGPQDSPLGFLRDNSTAHLELRYSF